VYFIADADHDYDLYSYDIASGRSLRLTRGMGGIFTPAAAGGKLWFSAFRRGSMHVYAGRPENFLYEKPEGAPLEAETDFSIVPATGTVSPYKFKASTDLFFPALMFSAPGGLFWMNYWQASDITGNNNLSLYLTYNSGDDYLSLQSNYSYARYRMPVLLQNTVENYDGGIDSAGYTYNKRYSRSAVGTAWPFDRYNRVESYLVVQNETYRYTDLPETDRHHTRALETSYVRDTVDGLYLIANQGSRTQLSWEKAVDTAGGNLKYDAYTLQYLKYFPLSKRAAFVNRFTAALSTGRDRRYFDFGGLGGLRGFPSYSDDYDKTGVLMDNAELRVPLVKDLNYYMWYMFPDFYFKAVYGKLFMDSAYGWNDDAELRAFRRSVVDTSIGAGVDIHTFLLQDFQLVLSFDYAVRTSDGGKIFYFYLGPMF
jgi:outer membrane protein assembly factor BamA